MQTGKIPEALKAFEESLAFNERQCKANPTATYFQEKLSACLTNIGALQNLTGKPNESLDAHERSLAVLQKLIAANPTVTSYQESRALCLYNIAIVRNNIARSQGKPDNRVQELLLEAWKRTRS